MPVYEKFFLLKMPLASSIDVRKSLLLLAALFYFVYLAFGNLLRVVSFPIFNDNLALSEFILYAYCLFCFFLLKVSKKRLFHSSLFSLLVIGSCVYGALLHGFDLKATFHAIRLICILFSAVTLSEIFFIFFRGDVTEVLHFFLKAYIVALILGFLIYVFFPESQVLWFFLEKFNIIFHGDPHQGRFISVYFDPNFYSNISFLPLLMSLTLFQKTKKYKYFVLSFLFLLSGILAWSRSGFFVLAFLLLILALRKSQFFSRFLGRRSIVYGLLFFVIGCSAVTILLREDLYYFLHRSLDIKDDVSALTRLLSFQHGVTFLEESPLFGIGYNYLSRCCEGLFSLSSVDSSLLLTAITFGCVPGLFISLYMMFMFITMKSSFYKIKKIDPVIYGFCLYFFIYLLVVVFFSSFFINILYYPPWLLPILTLIFYLSKASKEIVQVNRAQ